MTSRPPSKGVNVSSARAHSFPAAAAPSPVCVASEAAPSRRIREATFDDYAHIAALQQRNGLTPRSYAGWTALWLANPAFRRGEPIGWVLESDDRAIGGYIGNLPLAYRFRGRELRAVTPYSWAADAAVRGYSLALLDRLVRQPGIDLIVCTTPNAPAGRAYDAYQFRRAPVGDWDKCGLWITNYRGFSRSALRSEGIGAALSYPVAAALHLRDAFRRRRSHQPVFELCRTFDSRFEGFWEEMNPGRLTAVRDREALEWHFGPALQAGNAWIFAASQADRLVAYAILDRQDNPALELKRVRLVDFQALGGWAHLIHLALAQTLDYARSHGIHVVENAGCWVSRWGASAPYRRSLKTWSFYYKARHPALARELEDPEVWAPSAFDGDASL